MAEINSPYHGTLFPIDASTDGDIGAHRFMAIQADGDVAPAGVNDDAIIGVNPLPVTIPSGENLAFGNAGPVTGPGIPVEADVPINEDERIKSGALGKAIPAMTAELSGTTIDDDATAGNFANQPANDTIQAVSDDAGDTSQTVTIWYTRDGQGDTVFKDTIELNGTTAVDGSDSDAQLLLGAELDATADGTVTLQEKSGSAAITTITTGNTTAGVEDVDAANQRLGLNVAPTAVADGASTKQVGLIGTDENGDEQLDSQALDGTTAVTMNETFQTVTRVLVGDVATGTTVTFAAGAQDSDTVVAGRAVEAAAAAGDYFYAKIP